MSEIDDDHEHEQEHGGKKADGLGFVKTAMIADGAARRPYQATGDVELVRETERKMARNPRRLQLFPLPDDVFVIPAIDQGVDLAVGPGAEKDTAFNAFPEKDVG